LFLHDFMASTSSTGTRINKYLSEVGHCSRRAADALLEQGRITINGVVPELGTRVQPGDRVEVDGVAVATHDQERIILAYHKPVGIVCTTDTRREKDNIVDAINFPTRIYPVGRLDKMSEGLIFLTNDGDIVNDILRARYGHEKEYLVTVDRAIDAAFVRAMGAGVPILDTVTLPCEVEATGTHSFRIILKQGLNRQIRRMCEALGYRVRRLRRVRIMNVELGALPVGAYRSLDDLEMRELRALTRGAKS
jgi:23S rRNA pseudouridine2604 synthase